MVIPRTQLLLRIVRGLKLDDILFNCHEHFLEVQSHLFILPKEIDTKNYIIPIMTVAFHQSRHSYATTICLSNRVPIEILSKLMGHTSIRSTQIYAKITAEKVSNDIWMSTNELINLFGVIQSTLRANITAIYKSGILDECKVQRCINLSNGISIDVYALPMIVTLSFRLNTLGAYKIREYIIEKLTTNSRNHILFFNMRTHECMSENKYGHN